MPKDWAANSDIDIALVDSLFGSEGDGRIREKDLIGSDEPYTHAHGTWIEDILLGGATDATIHCYRIMDDEGEYTRWDFIQVLYDIILNTEIDIVNLSFGDYKPSCAGHCRECKTVSDVVESGKHVIVAHGDSTTLDGVSCPGKCDDTISVSGFQDLCRFNPQVATQAIWIKYSDDGSTDQSYTEALCSHLGCNDRMRCNRNRTRREWDKNVDDPIEPPNVLAPMHHVLANEETLNLNRGTSLSCAYVTGSIASIFGELSKDDIPEPSELLTNVENLPIPMNFAGSVPCMDAALLLQQLID